MEAHKAVMLDNANCLRNMILASSMSQAEKMQALNIIQALSNMCEWTFDRNEELHRDNKFWVRKCNELKSEIEGTETYDDCLDDIRTIKRELKHYIKTCPKKRPKRDIAKIITAHVYLDALAKLQNRLHIMHCRKKAR